MQIDFATAGRISNSEGLSEVIRLAVDAVQSQVAGAEGLLGPLDGLGVAQPLLIAKNVNRLAHNLARQLLQEIRVAIQDRRLVVILTGEHDLEEMVHGPNSELDIDGRYVIQGFGLEEFSSLCAQNSISVRFEVPEEAVELLWTCTGGNIDLLRAVLLAVQDHRLISDTSLAEPMSVPWLSNWLQKPETASQLVSQSTPPDREVPLSPDVWIY